MPIDVTDIFIPLSLRTRACEILTSDFKAHRFLQSQVQYECQDQIFAQTTQVTNNTECVIQIYFYSKLHILIKNLVIYSNRNYTYRNSY